MQEDELERLITADRLRSYTERTGTSTDALRLYEWNMRAAASVMELTGVVEVIARNALDRELHAWTAARTGAPWFDAVTLDGRGRADLAKARARASRDGRRAEVHGRVIAELTFGFWRYLVESRYHTSLWVPDLHRAFPHGPDNLRVRRSEVTRRLQQLHFVRNRAAHHEPIHARELQRDLDYALELLGWISPHAALWAADTTSLRAVLRARPDGEVQDRRGCGAVVHRRSEGASMSGPSVLFIGGSGVISAACVREAVEQGFAVTVLNRGTTGGRPIPDSVTRLQADVSDRSALADVLGDRRWDVVVNWIAFTPDQVQADVEYFAGRTRQYVFISSASAYQTPATHLPITESTPLKNPYWQYSRDKIACEELLVTAYREQDFPVTIVRPSHTYDETKLPLTGGWTAVARMRAGKPIIITGDGSSLWTITHSRDFAVGFTGLLDRAEAIGEAFTITSDEAPTWNQIAQEIAAAAGVDDLRIVHVPADAIAAADPEWGAALLGDKANSSVFDNSKVRSLVPWYRPRTPYRHGVREVIAWYEANPEAQVVDERLDALMDELAERWAV